MELESVRRMYKASRQAFGWSQVVEICRDMALGASLVPTADNAPAAIAPAGNVATKPMSGLHGVQVG